MQQIGVQDPSTNTSAPRLCWKWRRFTMRTFMRLFWNRWLLQKRFKYCKPSLAWVLVLMNFYQIGAQCYRGWLTASLEPSNGQEAIVVGHAGGTGRVAGMCGALLCETPDKRRFKASFTSKSVSIWCCLRPYKFPQSWNDTRCCTLKKRIT